MTKNGRAWPMPKILPLLAMLLIFCSSIGFPSLKQGGSPAAWGFYGHRLINRQAVFTLPLEMVPFFKRNIGYLTDHAIDPDKRRYASPHEAARHYIDLDRYGKPPFDNLPRNWTDALLRHSGLFFIDKKNDTLDLLLRNADGSLVGSDGNWAFNPALTGDTAQLVKTRDLRFFFNRNFLATFYDEKWTASCDSLAQLLGLDKNTLNCRQLLAVDHLSEHGIVPWHLQHMLRRLTDAFLEKDPDKIRRFAADIGHYIADAHVPLHTTQNYNGQLTGQDGIHAFWESRLPELFAERDYDFWVGQAVFIEDAETYFWNIALDSHALVDSVLSVEKRLRENFPPDRQLCNEMRGEKILLTQCEEFAAAYSEQMAGMVEKRMQGAIQAVGSAWFTAWVLAGQPDLANLDGELQVAVDSTDLELDKAVNEGKQFGREH